MLSESTPNSEREIARQLDVLGIVPVFREDKIDGSDVASITLAEAGVVLAAGYRPQLDVNVRTVNVLREDYDRMRLRIADLEAALAATGGETEWGVYFDEEGKTESVSSLRRAEMYVGDNPNNKLMRRTVAISEWVPVDPTSPETTEEQS